MANGFGGGEEFIHGNGDGPGNTSDTYTVCRVGVPRDRVVEEIREGLHPKYQLVHVRGIPYPRNKGNTKAIDNVNAPNGPWQCPAHAATLTAEGSLESFVECGRRGKMVEFIHGEKVNGKPQDRTYAICRPGVPRRRLVQEIEAGLHPSYQLAVEGDRLYPRPANTLVTEHWQCCMVTA